MANVTGLKSVVKAMRKQRSQKVKDTINNVFRAGLFIQGKSQERVPVDKGILHNSARTTMQVRASGVVVTVGYGTNYALIVHEDLTARHKVGQAKYLESVIREEEQEITAIAAGKRFF